jgi:hypothetical protein
MNLDSTHLFHLLVALTARDVKLAKLPSTASIVKARTINAENIAAVEAALEGTTK